MKLRHKAPTANARKRKKVKAANPLRIDPTKTITLRRSFAAKIKRKFALLKGRIVKLFIDQDALGLKRLTHNAALRSIPVVRQTTDYSCGAACFAAVARYYGVDPATEAAAIRVLGTTSADGTSPTQLLQAAQDAGLAYAAYYGMSIGDLEALQCPVIASVWMWGGAHYVVVTKVQDGRVEYMDPSAGYASMPAQRFEGLWYDDEGGEQLGVVLWRGADGQPTANEIIRDSIGRFASAAGGLEHKVAKKIGGIVKGLPIAVRLPVLAAYHAVSASFTAGQVLAERVAKERGLSDYQAHRLRGILATVDAAAAKPAALLGGMAGVGHGIGFVPLASTGYLMYSTARNPMATYRAAKGLIGGAVKGVKDAVHTITHPMGLVGNVADDQADALANALALHDYDDWYIALLHAALEDSLLADAIDRADAAYKEHPKSPQPVVNDVQWYLLTDAEKIEAFQAWLETQLEDLLLNSTEEDLWLLYTQQGFLKGAGRAFDDVNKARQGLAVGDQAKLDFYDGTKDQFLRSAFGQAVSVEKVKLLAGRSFDDLEGVTSDMSVKMSRALTDGLVEGKGAREIAADLTEQADLSRERALTVARTECFLGDTLVDGAVVRAAFRRWYVGPVIEIETRGRGKFTATPNHPMLTVGGWKAAGELKQGDGLIRSGGEQGFCVPRNEDVQRGPSTIREIFDSLYAIGVVERRCTGQPDFHGDGMDGQVDIASANGELRIGDFSPLGKHSLENVFSPADSCGMAFCSTCGGLLPVNSGVHCCIGAQGNAGLNEPVLDAATMKSQRQPDGNHRFAGLVTPHDVGNVNVGAVLVADAPISPRQQLGFAVTPADAFLPKDLSDLLLFRADDSCNLSLGFPAQIELDDVLTVRIRPFAGHVYNLETSFGYYMVNKGYYTGNCIRAHAEGQLDAMEEMGVEEVGVAVEWSTAQDNAVCDECSPMEGVVLSLDEAHGMIPAHPNCRCAFLPANVGEDKKGQKRSKSAIDKAGRAAGLDLDVDDDRPESILDNFDLAAYLTGNANPNHDEHGRFAAGEAVASAMSRADALQPLHDAAGRIAGIESGGGGRREKWEAYKAHEPHIREAMLSAVKEASAKAVGDVATATGKPAEKVADALSRASEKYAKAVASDLRDEVKDGLVSGELVDLPRAHAIQQSFDETFGAAADRLSPENPGAVLDHLEKHVLGVVRPAWLRDEATVAMKPGVRYAGVEAMRKPLERRQVGNMNPNHDAKGEFASAPGGGASKFTGQIVGHKEKIRADEIEKEVARAIGARWEEDSKPYDANTKDGKHFIEVKSKLMGKKKEISVHDDALYRKVKLLEEHPGATFHTVVVDERNTYGNGAHAEHYSGNRMYYKRGNGRYTPSQMQPVKNAAELKRLIYTPDHELPEAARGGLPTGKEAEKLKDSAEKAHASRLRKDQTRKARLKAEGKSAYERQT